MRFSALGDSAIVAECGDGISPQTLQRVRHFANMVAQAAIPGITDIVPAFATVTVFYETTKIHGLTGQAYPHLLQILRDLSAGLSSKQASAMGKEKVVEIPVCY